MRTITPKITNNGNQSSKIVKTAKFPKVWERKLKGNQWVVSWYLQRDQKVSIATTRKFSIGQHILKKDAKWYGLRWMQHSVKDFTRGRPYNIQATREMVG